MDSNAIKKKKGCTANKRISAKAKRLMCIAVSLAVMLGAFYAEAFTLGIHAATDMYKKLIPTGSESSLASKIVTFNDRKWYLIEDNSTSATKGSVTLLAAGDDYGWAVFANGYSNDYSKSDIKNTLDEMTETGDFADVARGIKNVTLKDANNVTAKLYLLSVNEAEALPINVRAYYRDWWLRTEGMTDEHAAVCYGFNDEEASIDEAGGKVYKKNGLRPALQLDLSEVTFLSGSNTFILAGLKDISSATVTGLGAKAWTGSQVTPEVTVKLDGKTLTKGTDYTVAYANNVSAGTATVTITGKRDYTGTVKKTFTIKKPNLTYRAYVQKHGWMDTKSARIGTYTDEKTFAGTTDNLRMETIQMQLSGIGGEVRYRAYCQKKGWTGIKTASGGWATTANKNTSAGTKGESKRVEMIQLNAKGQIANLYNIYYRTYCEKFGWLGWAGNNEKSGSAGYARKLEAFQIQLVPKGTKFNKGTAKAFYDSTKDGF